MNLNHGSMLTAPVVIGVVDAQWRVGRVSSDIGPLLGYEPSECVGAGVFVAVHPEDLPDLLVGVGHAVESGMAARLDVRLWHKSKGWAPTKVVVSPLDPGEPFPFGFVATRSEHPPTEDLEARLAALEMRLQRIAVEVHSAGMTVPVGRDSQPGLGPGALTSLSARQTEILHRLTRGQRVPTVARELGVSQSTVRNHLSQMFRKLKVRSQAELLELVQRPGT